jgi:hypothetical protein
MKEVHVAIILFFCFIVVILLYNSYKSKQIVVEYRQPIPRRTHVLPYWTYYGEPNWSLHGGTNIRPPRFTRYGYTGVATGGF